MAGTVHTQAYKDVPTALIEARRQAGLSQAKLAAKLNKPASIVGKYELGERRLDIVEFLVVLKALEITEKAFWAQARVDPPDTL